jgi:hypothetical protein
MERHNVKTLQTTTEFSGSSFTSPYDSARSLTPPHLTSWPDTSFVHTSTQAVVPDFASGLIFQQHGEAEMDFSLGHFVRTVTQTFPSLSNSSSPESVNLDVHPLISTQQPWPPMVSQELW